MQFYLLDIEATLDNGEKVHIHHSFSVSFEDRHGAPRTEEDMEEEAFRRAHEMWEDFLHANKVVNARPCIWKQIPFRA